MTTRYLLDKNGGFTCGDTVTGMTSYAYPTSANATRAKRSPAARLAIAQDMLANEKRHGFAHEADYDALNWASITRHDQRPR